MVPLGPGEIMRLTSELIELRARSEKILEKSKRSIQEYREAIEPSQRLLDDKPRVAAESR